MSHLTRTSTYLPKYHEMKLRKYSKSRQISIARLIAFAIDRELQMERPFEFNCELHNEEYIEYAYAEEASRILNFMKTLKIGAGLDILVLLRFGMKIPDKDIFLAAFTECLDKDMVEGFVPTAKGNRPAHPIGYLYYRVKGMSPKDKKAKKKRGSEFETYNRLKGKFEGKEE